MAAELWIPETSREPTAKCHLCESEIPQRKFARHIKRCVSRNWDSIEEAVHEHYHGEGSGFRTHLDTEQVLWNRKQIAERGSTKRRRTH